MRVDLWYSLILNYILIMWRPGSPAQGEYDPWAPQNIDPTNIEYPTFDSVVLPHPKEHSKQQNTNNQPYNALGQPPLQPGFSFPQATTAQNGRGNSEGTQDKGHNNYADLPWNKQQEVARNDYLDLPKDNTEKPKVSPPVFKQPMEQPKKPLNLLEAFNPETGKLPMNLWSSKFASVLRRNIQMSVFQIKKKVNFEGGDDLNWVEDQKKRHQSKFFDPTMNNLLDLINEQVVLLEASPHEQKLKELRKRGDVFMDEDFPPTQQSLSGEWKHVKGWENITWRRITSIIQKPVIFDKKVVPESIKQGILGDCYLLAALASLAESPQRIFNLFLTTQQNPQKYYAVKMLYKGMWKTIDIDEYIPTLNNKPAFSKALGPQLWVVLLEKAWAKLYGSYRNIASGYPEEGLHDLTGAHVEMLRLHRKEFNPENAWKYLMESSMKKYSMIASSQPGSDDQQSTSGVVLGHAYTVMSVYQLKIDGKLERLIKLRNPWGRTETKGSWSDKDPIWKTLPKEEKRRLGYVENEHDGICFQTYRDFLKDFRTITVAEVSDTASYVYHTQETTPFKGCYFKVKVLKEGEYSLQINQTPDRMFPKDIQKNFKYHPSTMLIGRIDGNKVRYYEGSQEPYRTIYRKHRLVPGDYVVFGKIYYSKYETDYSVTLSIYGESVCMIEACPASYCPNFKEKLYMDKAKHGKYKELKSGIFYNQEILTEGFIYCAVWNRSPRSAKFNINIEKNQNPSVRVKGAFKNQKNIKLAIEPNGEHIILARVPDFTNPTGGLGSVQFVG